MNVVRWLRPISLTCVLAFPVAAQADTVNLMQRSPTAQEIVDALAPSGGTSSGPKMRGLRLNAAPATARQAQPRAALDIKFDYNSAVLTPQGKKGLETLAEAMRSNQLSGSRFVIEGHADATGSAAYNQTLSERRARSARDYLVAVQGIEPSRLMSVGRGETEPLDPSDPTNWQNCRVEIANLGSR